MKIGLRTIKTVVASVLSMVIAEYLGLKFATAAGVISILSLGNTKKSSFYAGFGRLISLAIATLISFICFHFLGYQPIAFGVFLLIFIPIVVQLNLTDGIVVNSVLVTHYMLEQSFSTSLIVNEFLLMSIGVGLALLMNVYMPNRLEKLMEEQLVVEDMFRKLIWDIGKNLNGPDETNLIAYSHQLLERIHWGIQQAKLVSADHFFTATDFYEPYFMMRGSQVRILQDMIHLQSEIHVDDEFVSELKDLIQFSAETFDEKNDGRLLLEKIEAMNKFYRDQALPKNREEFENRARLFQFLQSFRSFVELKSEFFLNSKH